MAQTDPVSPRVNHVMLYVKDLDRSVGLYTTAFDFEVTNNVKEIIRVADDGSEQSIPVNMALLKFPGQNFVYEMAENTTLPDSISTTGAFQHVGIDVKDISAALDRALRAGFVMRDTIRTVKATGNIEAMNCFLTGPDGETVELMQMVAGEF